MILTTQYVAAMFISSIIPLIFAVNAVAHEHAERCIFDLLQPNGLIQSPNRTVLKDIFIDENSSSNVTCRWIIFPQSGIIKLDFAKLKMGPKSSSNHCDAFVSLTLVDRSAVAFGDQKEKELCGSYPATSYYSKGPSLELHLKGYLLHPSYDNYSFEALYSTIETLPTVLRTCDPCGGTLTGNTGMIRSPRFPKAYPNNCDCKWIVHVRKGYVIKFKFWSFSLEPMEDYVCHDFVAIYDGSSGSAKSLGKFCGRRSPGTLLTTDNYAFVNFHSDFSNTYNGFEVMYESKRNEEDLTSLRSIAAILGGVSFGIFIFLLLCSIIYKRYIHNDDRRNTCPPAGNGENDYLDAVQAAAPPSYHTVMADPEHYPRTPEVTPAASPVVTPSLLRRNLIRPSPLHHDGTRHLESLEEDQGNGVETPPPPYPGNISTFDNILIKDLPPPPTYEMVSDNEEHEESTPTWEPLEIRVDPRIDTFHEGQSNSSSNTDSTGTQVTSCESSRSDSNRPVALESPDTPSCSRISNEYDSLCVQCIEDSELDSQSCRQRSDGDLRGNYSLINDVYQERTIQCRHGRPGSQPLRRRRTSNGSSANDNNSDKKDIPRDKKKMRWLLAHIKRSQSVPSLNQRCEAAEQHRASVRLNHSPNTIRTLFSRRNHNHNSNRIQPNYPSTGTSSASEVVHFEPGSAWPEAGPVRSEAGLVRSEAVPIRSEAGAIRPEAEAVLSDVDAARTLQYEQDRSRSSHI